MSTAYRPACLVRVFLETTDDIEYWTQALNCTEPELTTAIATAGTTRMAIQRYLKQQRAVPISELRLHTPTAQRRGKRLVEDA